jgi:hypothetical protein
MSCGFWISSVCKGRKDRGQGRKEGGGEDRKDRKDKKDINPSFCSHGVLASCFQGKELTVCHVLDFTTAIYTCQFSPDGQMLALGGIDVFKVFGP